MSILLYQSTKEKKKNSINIKGNNFLFIGKFNQKYSYLLYKTGVNLKVYKNKNEKIIISGRHFFKKKINLFKSSILDIKNNLSGHYLVFKIKKNKSIEILNDGCASIPLYTYKNKDENIFSNRIDWILASSNNYFKIDWIQLFIYTLTNNYNKNNTFLKKIFFLEPSTNLVITKKECLINDIDKERTRHKIKINNQIEKLSNILLDNLKIISKKHKKIALPITGGLDSRLILAGCLNLRKKKLITFTHGFKSFKNYPDIGLAQKISNIAGIKHKFVNLDKKIYHSISKSENNQKIYAYSGHARHKDIFEENLYDLYDKYNYNLELKGLLGSVFKAKWDYKSLAHNLDKKQFLKFKHYFYEKEISPDNIQRIFSNLKKLKNKKIILSSKLFNRNSPKIFYQNERFRSVNPFVDTEFIKEYLKIPKDLRKGGKVHLKLIQILYPKFTSVPFLKGYNYYLFKNDQIEQMNYKEIKKNNLFFINRKNFFNRLKKYIKHLIFRNLISYIPSDYEVIRNELNNYIIKEIKDFDRVIPNQLNVKDLIKDIQDPKKIDSRIYRLYSILKFINYCNKKTKKIY